MRPVNLIPPEARRGQRAPARTGAAAYIVVGILAVALVAITMVVLTNNDISDGKAQVAALEQQEVEARQLAESLAPFAEFASLEQARTQTVTSLAESRFDWERVLRELALVATDDVWLTTLSGTVRPDVTLTEEAGDSELRQAVAGPALEIVGCGIDHRAVAKFLAALEDIDGVTRVAVNNSERPSPAELDAADAGASESKCGALKSVTEFEAVAAFDEVPVTAPTAAPTVPPAEAAPATAAPAQVTDAREQEDQAHDSAEGQSEKGRDAATNLIPGAVR